MVTNEERAELDRLNVKLTHLDPMKADDRIWIRAIENRIREIMDGATWQ